MTPLLDRFARAVAGASMGGDREDRLGRSTLLRRGFAGAVALSTLGHLVESPKATAATCPSGTLDNCIQASYRAFRAELAGACDKAPSFAEKFQCLRESHSVQRNLQRVCERRCPPPKRKRQPGSKPTKTARRTPKPPALPPNPYDDGGLCAACTSWPANGRCCWGGNLPGGFCACAELTTECKVYGCP